MSEQNVAKIHKLVIYPLKSAAGMFLKEANITAEGLQDVKSGLMDRHFVMINDKGRVIQSKPDQEPKLLLMKPSVQDNMLQFDAPGMDPLKISLNPEDHKSGNDINIRLHMEDSVGRDCGDETAAWLLKFFGKPYRLVFSAPDLPKRQLINSGKTQFHKKARPGDQVVYQGLAPVHMLSVKSVDDLNNKLKKPVEGQCFRPNIWIDGCEAYAEDNWRNVRIGDVKLSYCKHTDRCLLTTVDVNTAESDPEQEPFNTLKTYRVVPEVHPTKGCLGMSYFLDNTGTIKIGDPVIHVSS